MLLEWEKLYRNKVMVLQAKTGIDTKARIDQITEGVENLPVRLSIPVVHKEEVQVPDVVNQKLDKTTRQHMSGLFVGPIADVGHQCGSLELAANPRINTLRPSPVCLRNKQHHHPGWNSNWMLQQQHTKFKKEKCWYHPKPKSIQNSLQAYWGGKKKREKEKGSRSRRQRKTNLNTDFAVMLHALELLDPLLNDIALDQRRDHRC